MCLHFLSGTGEGLRGSGVRCGSGVGLTRLGPSCPELLGACRARLQTTALKNKPLRPGRVSWASRSVHQGRWAGAGRGWGAEGPAVLGALSCPGVLRGQLM